MTIPSIRFRAVRRSASSPLGPYVRPYITQLQAQGYQPTPIRSQLRHMVSLNRWLTRTRRDLGDLNEEVLDRFWRCRLPGQKRSSAAPALDLILAILRKAGVTPPPAGGSQTPAQRLPGRYRRYLVEERGLSHWTVDYYSRHVERFVAHPFGAGSATPSCIRAHDVIEYVQRHAHTHTLQQTRYVVTALRSFLRFLLYQGLVRTDLAAVLPALAHWRMTGLPKQLPAEAVRPMLDRCHQTTPVGLRDYAILLLLARLGLRAGEVVALQLEDIDWDNTQITIRSRKGRGWAQRIPGIRR